MNGVSVFLLAMFWGLGSFVYAAAWDWEALESHPFRVYYKTAQLPKAKQVLTALKLSGPPIMDYWNETVSGPDSYGVLPDLSSRPWVEVVLDDRGVVSNGFVEPSSGRIVFLQGMPDTRYFLQMGAYWEYLSAHELTHYAQLRMTRASQGLFAWLVPPLSYPNKLLPLFLVEGAAVWSESQNGQYGRLHDGHTFAVMNARLQDPKPLDLPSLRYPYYQYPYGDTPYLYGGRFTQFLAQTRSDIALRDMYARHVENKWGAVAGYLFPQFGIDAASAAIYRKSVPELVAEWETSERARVSSQTWAQKTHSEGLKRFLSVHRGHIYYVKTSYRHPEPFAVLSPRYDVIRWSESEGELLVYRSQRPIVGMQFGGTSMVLLLDDVVSGFDNHSQLGYGISRLLQKISITHAAVETLASGPIVAFTLKEDQVFYTTPRQDGAGSDLWGIFNSKSERLGSLPVYVAEMVPFQRQLAIVAKTAGESWQLLSLDPGNLQMMPLIKGQMGLGRIWSDASDIYVSLNAPLGYHLYRFRGQSSTLEQLTTSNHVMYGVPLADRLFVLGVTASGEELFSLPLAPQAAGVLPPQQLSLHPGNIQSLSNFEALGTDLDGLLPHRPSIGKNSLGVFGEDKLSLMSYHVGYRDGFDLDVRTRIFSPLELQGSFSSVGNAFQASWPFFRSWAPGVSLVSAQLRYRWDEWVPALHANLQWWDTRLGQTVGVGLRGGYTLRSSLSQILGDGTFRILFERDSEMEREDNRRGYEATHLDRMTGDRIEVSLTQHLAAIRKGWWSPDLFFGDLFGHVYLGSQSFGDAGTYYGLELQQEMYTAGGMQLSPYLGWVNYPFEDIWYAGVSLRMGDF
jgi:hypothetical protein